MAATSSIARARADSRIRAAAEVLQQRDLVRTIFSPTEADWPPDMKRTVMKSPMTSVTTKIEPMAMPGLASGMITLVRIWKALAGVPRGIDQRPVDAQSAC